MKKNRRDLLIVFIVIVLISAIALFPHFFYNNLIDPITRIFWLLIRSIFSIDQEFLWIMLIVIALVMGVFLIPTGRNEDFHSAYSYLDKVENRTSYSKALFRSAENTSENRQLLQNNLEELSQSIKEIVGKDEKQEILTQKSSFGISQIITRLWRMTKKKFLPQCVEFTDIELERYVNQKLDSMESLLERQNER